MIVVVGAVCPEVGGPPQPVEAAATLTVARYEMNEGAAASVLVDSSGNGLNGSIGPNVVTSVEFDGATAHRFLNRSPTMPPTEPERLDTVPHTTLLNPDTQDFSITVRYRTSRPFGNLIQKGQNGTAGGYFKIELPFGRPTCLFKGVGPGGVIQQRSIEAPLNMGLELNDNQWHTITCERLQNRIALYIDGPEVKRLVGPTGTIANNKNLSIAGKSNCDQIETTCDYFVGDIDWIRLDKGSAPPPNVPPDASFTPPVCTFLACAFDASGSTDSDGSIVSYAWDFGDGATGTGTAPSHSYAAEGEYTVRLTVTDDDGDADSTTRVVGVTAPPNAPPTVAFSQPMCTLLACVFDASGSTDSDGSIVSYAWDFGDGATGSGTMAPHSYAAGGQYTVRLTVTDDDGATAATTRSVGVVAASEPPSGLNQLTSGAAATKPATRLAHFDDG